MRNTFVKCLIKQARLDDRIFVLSPDLGYSVLDKYAEEFNDRYINTGIAEQNTVSVASGLALSGYNVYVYSIIPFATMRCYEQIRLDVAYMKLKVRIVGVGAGFSYGPAGATHHAIEDIAIMRALPNMTVCCPGDPIEVREIMQESFTYSGPMYIRLGRNGEPNIHDEKVSFKIGESIHLVQGSDLAIITTSNILGLGKELTEKLAQAGKKSSLISMPTVKPIDKGVINQYIESNIPIVTLEEHNIFGGLGSAVAEVIAESGKSVKFRRIAINDEFCHYVGDQKYLREKMGLSVKNILDFLNSL